MRCESEKEMDLRVAISRFRTGDRGVELAREFERLLDEGMPEASQYLGMMHEDGTNGFTVDKIAARAAYRRAADEIGLYEGFLAIARMDYFGIGGPVDYHAAFETYQFVATNSELPVAWFRLGRMYQLGQGTAKDNLFARRWYRRAIELESMWAMMFLADLEFEEHRWLEYVKLRLRGIQIAWRYRKSRPYDVRLRPY